MPTYEYLCKACEHKFEQFQSITAEPLKKCPKCGKRSLQRLIGTGGGIIFKGSGFYETDYRSSSYQQAEKSEKSAATGGEKKDGATKSDTAGGTTEKKATPAAEKPKKATKKPDSQVA